MPLQGVRNGRADTVSRSYHAARGRALGEVKDRWGTKRKCLARSARVSEARPRGRQFLKNFKAGWVGQEEPQALGAAKIVPEPKNRMREEQEQRSRVQASESNFVEKVLAVSKALIPRLNDPNSGTKWPIPPQGGKPPGSQGWSCCPRRLLTPHSGRIARRKASFWDWGDWVPIPESCRGGGQRPSRLGEPGTAGWTPPRGDLCQPRARNSCSRHAPLWEDFKPWATTTSLRRPGRPSNRR